MKIDRNVGPADRLVRAVAGGSLVLFALLGLFPGAWSVALAVAGAAVAATGVLGYCPLYRAMRLGWRGGAGGHGTGGQG